MLLIKTYLDKSKIHGIGLFAAEDILPGRTIWKEGFELTYTPEDFENLAEAEKEFIREWGWLDKNDNLYHLPLDNDRFINHDANPNTKMLSNGWLAAKTLILMGDEILCDYREFEKEFRFAKNEQKI